MTCLLDKAVEQWKAHNKDPYAAAKALGVSVHELTKLLRLSNIKVKTGAKERRVGREDDIENLAAPLWEKFAKDRGIEYRNQLADLYWPVVARMAVNFARKKGFQPDDFYAPAATALLDTVDRFQPESGNRFLSFANHRIHGAMLDQCRMLDRATRTMRKKAKQRERAEAVVGKHPYAVQQFLNWTEKQYRESFVPSVSSIDESKFTDGTVEENQENPLVKCLGVTERTDMEAGDAFLELCKGCTMREMVLLYLYYACNLSIRQIGEIFGLSESRISQMHAKVVKDLRSRGREEILEEFNCKS